MNTVPVCLLANLYSGFFCIVSDGIYTVLLEDIYSNYCIQECILKKTEKSWDKRQMMLCIYYIKVMQLDCVNVIQVPSLSCVALQCDSSVKLLRLLSPPTQTSTFETASGSEIMARAEIFSFLLQKVSFLPLPSLTCLLLQIFFLQGKSTRKEGKKERKTLPPRPVALALVAVAHCCMSAWAGFLSLLLLVTQEGLQVELGFSQWCNESCQEWGKIFRINLHSQAANKSVVSTERDDFIPVACQQY